MWGASLQSSQCAHLAVVIIAQGCPGHLRNSRDSPGALGVKSFCVSCPAGRSQGQAEGGMWSGGQLLSEAQCQPPCSLLCLPAGGQPSSPDTQGVCGQSGELQEAVCPQAVEGGSGLRGGCGGLRWVPGSFQTPPGSLHFLTWQFPSAPSLSSPSALSPCVTTSPDP